MSLALEQVASPTDEARGLIEELEAELKGPYAAEQRHGLSLAQIFQPKIMYFIARRDGVAVGCGGVAFEEDFAELKRMYVRPRARGSGVASAILGRLEAEARDRGYRRLVLETGDVQFAAVRLYERAGFTRCPPFGHYVEMPGPAIERSLFFEKWIG